MGSHVKWWCGGVGRRTRLYVSSPRAHQSKALLPCANACQHHTPNNTHPIPHTDLTHSDSFSHAWPAAFNYHYKPVSNPIHLISWHCTGRRACSVMKIMDSFGTPIMGDAAFGALDHDEFFRQLLDERSSALFVKGEAVLSLDCLFQTSQKQDEGDVQDEKGMLEVQ